jgi:flagellar hook-basal body complex protein FliE
MTYPIPGILPGNVNFDTAGGSARPSTPGSGSNSDFMNTLKGAMEQVSDLQSQADGKVTQLLTGNGQDVHSAMIAIEKANLSFQMMLQVRNKIVAAYQQISGIPF